MLTRSILTLLAILILAITLTPADLLANDPPEKTKKEQRQDDKQEADRLRLTGEKQGVKPYKPRRQGNLDGFGKTKDGKKTKSKDGSKKGGKGGRDDG